MAKNNSHQKLIRDHRRQWRNFLYVYPVISRRAKGLSIGVNLNPDKNCNFACLYCQVDRHRPRNLHKVDLDALARELDAVMQEIVSGEIWRQKRFEATPPNQQRANDIAFSGDGEPTCLPEFDKAVKTAVDIKRKYCRYDMKIVVITNASQFDKQQFLRALPLLMENNGEIWAKLDAGTDEYFQRVNNPHPKISLEKIAENIESIAYRMPLVIQTLFFKVDGRTPPESEIAAYCKRLEEILHAGGKIKLVQLHTIARSPISPRASALSDSQLDAIAKIVRAALGKTKGPDVPVEVYYGTDAGPQIKV